MGTKFLIIFSLFMTVLFTASLAQAQTVDEVIDKYVETLGGQEKLESLKTVRMQGTMNVQGFDVSVINTIKHLVGSRTDITLNKDQGYQLLTPEKGWTYLPWQGQDAPTEMAEDDFKFSYNQLDLESPLLNYSEKGNQVELIGKEISDGVEIYKIKVTNKWGFAAIYFIDSKTYFINKISTKKTINGVEAEVSTTFSNYQQDANGYWFAYQISSNAVTNYDKIETNIEVNDSIFKPN